MITSLSWFGAEKDIILSGLGDQLDLSVSPVDTADARRWPVIRALETKIVALVWHRARHQKLHPGGSVPLVESQSGSSLQSSTAYAILPWDLTPPRALPWSIEQGSCLRVPIRPVEDGGRDCGVDSASLVRN